MYILEKIKNKIAGEINKALGKKIIKASDFMYPPNPDMGDICLPCFKYKSIGIVVQELFDKIKDIREIDWTVSMSGAYINIKLGKESLAKDVLEKIKKQKDKYGENKSGKSKRVMIEYSNANTHKEYHVGHLRNICYGDAVSQILKVNGYKIISVSYINDFGIHVAKTLWALEKFFENKDLPNNKGEFLGQVYIRAVKESKDNEIAKKMIEGTMKKIESRQGEEYELWKKTRQWTINQFDVIYKELNIKFDHIYYESEFIDKGKKIVPKLLKQNIFKKSHGAIIADLEKYGLGVLVVLRSDGTATYPVADIPLAMAKFKDYKIDKSIYVVDNRQELYFRQLFKILELMNYKQEKLHLKYDFVKLPEGMMSSRSGNTVTYKELKLKLFKNIIKEIKKRHEDWDENKINNIALAITQGAMKFEMLKIGADQVITFDIKKALSFQGYTAAYLQYTYARINSIINKSGLKINNKKIDYSKLSDKKESELILKLAKYPEIIKRAGEKYDPSEVARYLFELTQNFNDYYHSVSVLKTETEIKIARLFLIANINQVIKNGLDLLGIGALEEM